MNVAATIAAPVLPVNPVQPLVRDEAVGFARAGDRQADESEQARDSERPTRAGASSGGDLTEEEQRELRELQQRDRAVRAHEQAHVAVGGSLVLRGAVFEYEIGPDGNRYAVAGEVLIDTSPGRTPEETVAKAERIVATALAPIDPSPQDRQVAAEARRMAAEARIEIAREAQQDLGTEPADEADSDAMNADGADMAASSPGASMMLDRAGAIQDYARLDRPAAEAGGLLDLYA